MVSRLMFSLRKAVDKPPGSWTMGDSNGGSSPEGGTLHSALQWFSASHEISGILTSLNGEVIELGSMPRSPRDRGSQRQH